MCDVCVVHMVCVVCVCGGCVVYVHVMCVMCVCDVLGGVCDVCVVCVCVCVFLPEPRRSLFTVFYYLDPHTQD